MVRDEIRQFLSGEAAPGRRHGDGAVRGDDQCGDQFTVAREPDVTLQLIGQLCLDLVLELAQP
ncbi:hypothetical protein [Amycolatopsis sp. cmx-11-51]|uniref:hypothetical protein n=1 Tax=unclassified Amycolatopsis TaxID=2618356 RepID=UPI0039E3D01F